MRYLCIVVSLFLFSTAAAAERFAVRPLDPAAGELLDRAVRTSEVVRALVETLEASNVIVHVQVSRELPAGIGGTTRFVTTRGGYRYLRIAIRTELSKEARIAILGHELKHACEVAESNAGDVESLRRLFATEGRLSDGFYDTHAAIRVERMVLRELRYRPSQ